LTQAWAKSWATTAGPALSATAPDAKQRRPVVARLGQGWTGMFAVPKTGNAAPFQAIGPTEANSRRFAAIKPLGLTAPKPPAAKRPRNPAPTRGTQAPGGLVNPAPTRGTQAPGDLVNLVDAAEALKAAGSADPIGILTSVAPVSHAPVPNGARWSLKQILAALARGN
jgi:hypothetical protein